MSVSNGIYQHFKGRRYEVVGTARHCETEELYVVYRPLYGDGGLWIRPALQFTQTVERDGKAVPRFALIASPDQC